jgi:hypothetical protein
MKKAIIFFVSILFIVSGFSQNNNNGKSMNYNIQVQMTDSARSFTVNYQNGEEFRKLLMIAWGRPALICAGKIEWTPLSLQDIGNNIKVTLSDGVETTEGTGTVFKPFTDDNSKYTILNNLQSNQTRKFNLVFTNQQGENIVNTKSVEKAVVNAIDRIVTSAR